MKLVTCFLIVFFVIGCVQQTDEDQIAASVAMTVEAMSSNPEATQMGGPTPILDDETLRTIQFYKDKVTNDVILFHSATLRHDLDTIITLSGTGADPQIALVDQYQGDDWIFIHSVVMNTGDNVYRFELCEEKRDVSDGGTMLEDIVICLDEADAKTVEDIVTADEVLVRYDGQDGDEDFTMIQRGRSITALRDMFQLYMNLSQGTIDIDRSMPAGADEGRQWWIKTNE